MVCGGWGGFGGRPIDLPATGRQGPGRMAQTVLFSYSHFGEDLIILRLLGDVPPDHRGMYVDVGAFDPVLHSNTYLLYTHGWRG